MTPPPEFSRPERVDTIGTPEKSVAIEADAGERAGLARRFALISIERLAANFAVRREGAAIVATGHVIGAVTQACSATGEPLTAAVDETVSLRFVDETETADELELSADALDTLPIENGAIDLGEAAAETLALALDPFPRHPDAEAMLAASGAMGEDASGPFAGLADLKRKLGD